MLIHLSFSVQALLERLSILELGIKDLTLENKVKETVAVTILREVSLFL